MSKAPIGDDCTQHWVGGVVVVVVVDVEVVVVELVVLLVVEVAQGFGVQTKEDGWKAPPSRPHWQRLWMLHWSKGPPGVLCVQQADGGVVVVGHGKPAQVPGPTFTPPAVEHSPADRI